MKFLFILLSMEWADAARLFARKLWYDHSPYSHDTANAILTSRNLPPNPADFAVATPRQWSPRPGVTLKERNEQAVWRVKAERSRPQHVVNVVIFGENELDPWAQARLVH